MRYTCVIRSAPALPAVASVLLIIAVFPPAGWARPEYLMRFLASPFSRPELQYCSVCHHNPEGGGPRNEFGQAFDREGRSITLSLRTRFPDRFLQDRALLGDGVEIVFEGGADNSIIVKKGNASYRVVPADKDLQRIEEVPAISTAASAVAATEPSKPRGGTPVFDYHLGNLRTDRVAGKGELHFRFSHRFTSPVFNQSRRPFDLFGLDTFAFTGLGIGYGISNRIAVNVYRQSWERKLEFSGDFSILDQLESKSPVSLLARAAVDGRNDFAAQGNRGHYVPSIQIVISRNFFNRVSLNVNPTFVFNLKRPDNLAVESRMAAIGLGGAVKIRENLAVVGEIVPRVTGNPLAGDFVHAEPTASFGLQYRTHRHVFEILFSNSWETNTAGSALGGPDEKHIGFNLFRRIK